MIQNMDMNKNVIHSFLIFYIKLDKFMSKWQIRGRQETRGIDSMMVTKFVKY